MSRYGAVAVVLGVVIAVMCGVFIICPSIRIVLPPHPPSVGILLPVWHEAPSFTSDDSFVVVVFFFYFFFFLLPSKPVSTSL
jgi:hypothetical protein